MNRIALWWCSVLYQATKPSTQLRAASMSAIFWRDVLRGMTATYGRSSSLA